MRLEKLICGISLLILSCTVLHLRVEAHEYRELMLDFAEMRPDTRSRRGEIAIIWGYPDGTKRPRYDLGTMFVPPRVVAHANSSYWMLPSPPFDVEVSRIYTNGGSLRADLRSPSLQSLYPAMRTGDLFYHLQERYFVTSLSSTSATVQGPFFGTVTMSVSGTPK